MIVKMLLEREDVTADSKDSKGRTPLSYAGETWCKAIVKMLLEREDVTADSKDSKGLDTALIRGGDVVRGDRKDAVGTGGCCCRLKGQQRSDTGLTCGEMGCQAIVKMSVGIGRMLLR